MGHHPIAGADDPVLEELGAKSLGDICQVLGGFLQQGA